jgi:hypothetical protein
MVVQDADDFSRTLRVRDSPTSAFCDVVKWAWDEVFEPLAFTDDFKALYVKVSPVSPAHQCVVLQVSVCRGEGCRARPSLCCTAGHFMSG